MIDSVSVLFVDPKGPYPSLVRDWWDASRDARAYAGPNPVVAHPPCGPWSSLRHLSQETTKDCALYALAAVRRWGGVLEHPKGSTLFDVMQLPKPGKLPDAYGGRTYEVSQCDWGHVARKRTWLYVVGNPVFPPTPAPRAPTHWVSGVQTAGARGKPPPGIKICSAEQRRRTPRYFAEWLVMVANGCRKNLHRI